MAVVGRLCICTLGAPRSARIPVPGPQRYGVRSCHVVFSRVNSPYFERNPGTAENLPRIAKYYTDVVYRRMWSCNRATRRTPEARVAPSFFVMLRLYGWIYRLAPALVLWLLRLTENSLNHLRAVTPTPSILPLIVAVWQFAPSLI